MAKRDLRTARGYDFFVVSSAMQKSIRRADAKIAGYCALELYHSGFSNYVWKRLLTVSAEDCADFITTEIWSLYQGFLLVNTGKTEMAKGRIFISKAVIVLCLAHKSRDADHLQNYIYDKKIDLSDAEIEQMADDLPPDIEIPDYAYDVHTKQGRWAGKTKEDFFNEEQEALRPKAEVNLFTYVIEREEKTT
jgi:replication-associated recombination protein RarA